MAVAKDRYELEIETKGALNGLRSLSGAMKAFAGVIAIREVVQFGQEVIRATATFQNLQKYTMLR